jgi:hypothetical protein
VLFPRKQLSNPWPVDSCTEETASRSQNTEIYSDAKRDRPAFGPGSTPILIGRFRETAFRFAPDLGSQSPMRITAIYAGHAKDEKRNNRINVDRNAH